MRCQARLRIDDTATGCLHSRSLDPQYPPNESRAPAAGAFEGRTACDSRDCGWPGPGTSRAVAGDPSHAPQAARAGTPGIVSGIHFDTVENTSFRAKWSRPSNGGQDLTGYGILLWTGHVVNDKPDYGEATTIGVPSEFLEDGILKQAQTLSGLAAGTTHHYLMHACNPIGCGHWSYPAKQVTTLATPTAAPLPTTPSSTPSVTAPHRPHSIRFWDTTSTSVRVTWSAASETGGAPLTGFDIMYWPYDSENPNSERGATTQRADDGNDQSETVRGLDPNTEYELKMRACNRPNNSNCSPWSADHRFTTTAPPTVDRPGSGIADQIYLAGQPVSVLLPAASGGGHWTYTFTPALTNRLSFDPSSRTIAGIPQQGANAVQHTYTATKTENGATTIETSQFNVAVFNLELWAERVDDEYARKLQGSTFWGGVYEHWSVLEYALMSIGDVLPSGVSRVGNYWFQLRLPASAGFQTNSSGGCDWDAAGQSDTTQLQTAWTPAYWGFYFVRCGIGSATAADVEIWVRDGGGTEALLQTRRLSGQAWHLDDHVASYRVRGTNGGTIQLVESTFGAGDGLFRSLRPDNLDSMEMPKALLGQPEQYTTAAAVWTAVEGVTVGRILSDDPPDVVIAGYWDTEPADGDDGVCRESIACVYVGGLYPYLKLEMEFFIEEPPHWGLIPMHARGRMNMENGKTTSSHFSTYLPFSSMSLGTRLAWGTAMIRPTS